MKRILRSFLSFVIVFALVFSTTSFESNAKFNDLKRSGVAFNLQKGNWTAVYTKLPGSSKMQKLYAKITKFYDSAKPAGGGTSGSSSSSGGSYKITIQIQFPKAMPKKIAQAFKARIDSGKTEGNYFIDYVDICFVDYKTGENLKVYQNDEEDGPNYKDSEVIKLQEDEWRYYKPQSVSWDGGSYDYYVSYARSFSIEVPSGYKNLCIGVCGSHISNYEKMVDWNQGFIDGYTVLSDTTHVKLGKRKKTAKLSHFIRIKTSS